MLLLSPVWQGRFTAMQRLANLTLRTFVIHPAMFFFLLFIFCANETGSGGLMLLHWAEEAVRDAAAGEVWACKSQDVPEPTVPADFPPLSRNDVTAKSELPEAPPSKCVKVAESRETWIFQKNNLLRELYLTSVMISVFASYSAHYFRRRHNRGK
ncbi:hypothetical protein P4910_23340 [Pantoea stewartii]|uniref:hypothetical protein n=1 Tax=Pantoea stewartii TaxID=66269 RepID=UPI0023F75D73|nr:hypothetical protein [Pantoea stewartii]MDF7788385.1 hypothetical protein [Pantoea stewartii]